MQELITSVKWNSSPTAYFSVSYERRRSGAAMEYRFSYNLWLQYSASYYYNALDLKFVLDGKYSFSYKVKGYNANETGWNYSGVTDWHTVYDKLEGTTSASIRIEDISAEKNKWTQNVSLAVDAAPSAFASLNDFDIDGSFVVGTTKYLSTVTDTLTIRIGATAIKTISNIGTSTNITFTESEKQTIYSLMPTTSRKDFIFILSSTHEGATLGTTSKTVYGNITNANPIVDADAIRAYDSNEAIVAVTGNAQTIVQMLSSICVSVPQATAQKGASMSAYYVYLDGALKIVSGGEVEYGNTSKEGNLLLRVVAQDSRGNSTVIEKNVFVTHYAEPIITASLYRKNNYEDETHLKANVQFTEIGANEIVSLKYAHAKVKEDYGQAVDIANGQEYILTCDKASAYTFRITATDAFGCSVSQEFALSKGEFPLFIDTRRNAVGINAFPSKGEALRVGGGVAMFENGVVIKSSTDGSTKRFRLSIDDNGALTITEYKD